MQTRRDQLHAYRFMTRRAMSALVTGEPDTVDPPMRRLVVLTLSGVMVAVVVAAAYAVIGLIRPGSDREWQADGTVVTERESGAAFVVIGTELHPVVNYPSAVLASRSTGTVKAKRVKAEDLAEVEWGPRIGIPGLPTTVPSDDALVSGPLTVCSQAALVAIEVQTQVTVDVGADTSTPLGEDEAVLVQSFERDRLFLLWRGQRHPVDADAALALGLGQTGVRVGGAFLNALPEATAFRGPALEGLGDRIELRDGVRLPVGQVIDDGSSSYVVLADGVAPVTPVQAALLKTLEVDGKDVDPTALPGFRASTEQAGDLADQTEGLPSSVPAIAEGAESAGGVCASYTDGTATARLALPDGDAPSDPPVSESEQSRLGMADVVTIDPAGSGLLARDPSGGAVSLVAAPGLRYDAPSLETLVGFGYDEEDVVDIPRSVLSVLPRGEAFDVDRALLTVGGTSSAAAPTP